MIKRTNNTLVIITLENKYYEILVNEKDYFYSFPKHDWDDSMEKHMSYKNWFTKEMENYINNKTNKKC